MKANSAPRPILVRWLWNECHLVGGVRAFVVEVPAELMPNDVREDGTFPPAAGVDAYLAAVERQSENWPSTVVAGHVTCIMSSDGHIVRAFENPFFPYSSQWNGYCPLVRVGILIAELADASRIPDDVIESALTDDLHSTWCLSREAWDGTDLGASGLLGDQN